MPLLFSYGSLQQEEMQLSTFGRKLAGEKDLLIGYEPSLVKIADPEVAKRLEEQGAMPVKQTSAEFGKYMQDEAARCISIGRTRAC